MAQSFTGTQIESPAAEPATTIRDAFGRPLRSLRISVTDRCNFRCLYCMPEKEYVWLPRQDILSFEETAELAGIFANLGIEKIRLTGGEPLLRQNLDTLVRMLASNPRLRDLALTTNGMLLAQQARPLREAGLSRVTVSLDTLRPERFRALTSRGDLAKVLEGISAARAAGFQRIKINSVIIGGFNEDELADLLEFARKIQGEVRFIEYMDVGGATRWTAEQVFPCAKMLAELARRYGPIRAAEEDGSAQASLRNLNAVETAYEQPDADETSEPAPHSEIAAQASAPAERYQLPDGTTFGIISSTTKPFCGTCDRARLTPDGLFLLCLYANRGVDLKRLLRAGVSHAEISRVIANTWRARTDRGAEERLRVTSRGPLFHIGQLRQDPHREMHTRGG